MDYKKGTTIIGVICKDGIVIGADKRTSAGYTVAKRTSIKVHPISRNLVLAKAGLVSDAQRTLKIIKALIKLEELKTKRQVSVKWASSQLSQMLYNKSREYSMVESVVGLIVGGIDDTGHYLYEIGTDGSLLAAEGFVASGSGSTFSIGVLETLYKEDLTIDQGIDLTKKALRAAIERDMFTGNGMDIYTITKKGVKHAEKVKVVLKSN
tara:strand:+ start:6054 stop:6680 length:627 start_codon:yes stop_codon:yes gene_type:complete